MAMGIALQPVPPDLARVVTIVCNDCEERDENRRWHFLGVQCLKCTSFNTIIETTQYVGLEAAAFLGDPMPTEPDVNGTQRNSNNIPTNGGSSRSLGGDTISFAEEVDMETTTPLNDVRPSLRSITRSLDGIDFRQSLQDDDGDEDNQILDFNRL